MSEILMPRLSDTMEEGVVSSWHKKPGDRVAVGDALVDIETDKALMEYEAYEEGVLGEILVPEGGTASIGTPIATLVTNESTDGTAPTPRPPAEPAAAPEPALAAPAPAAAAPDPAAPMPAEPVPTVNGTAPAPQPAVPQPAPTGPGGRSPSRPGADPTSIVQRAPQPPEGHVSPVDNSGLPLLLPPRGVGSGRSRPPSSPLARRIARESGVDLAALTGSGPGGRIVRADVEAAVRAAAVMSTPPGTSTPPGVAATSAPQVTPTASVTSTPHGLAGTSAPQVTATASVTSTPHGVIATPAPSATSTPSVTSSSHGVAVAATSTSTPPITSQPTPQPVRQAALSAETAGTVREADPDTERVPLSRIRKVTARRLAESMRAAPHFYLTRVVDAEDLLAFRTTLNAALAPAKVSVNDLIVKACATALRANPVLNVSFTEEHLLVHKRVHVGVAVALDEGLVVPVVRDADRKSVSAIGAETRELAGRAREQRLTPQEMSGGTFTVSNLGMFGVDAFTAVINPPEAAILAVGATRKDVVFRDGEVVPRDRMTLTLSIDHRACDGATGARFLGELAELLENPLRIVA